MNPELQRIKIAEACGWEIPNHCRTKRIIAGETQKQASGAPPDFGKDPSGEWRNELPDYLNDLNAMREAERSLMKYPSGSVMVSYVSNLKRVATRPGDMGWGAATATAAQRAEAFLRTLDLWTENTRPA